MKKLLSVSLIAACLLSIQNIHAQDVIQGQQDMYPSFVDFKNAPPKFSKGTVLLAGENGKVDASSKVLFKHTEKDALGIEHYRYQQTFSGDIPVENAVYVMHVKDGSVLRQNGKWISKFPADIKTTPTITKAAALNLALNKVGAQQYKWQNAAEEAFIKEEENNPNATFYPAAKLVFYSGEEEVVPSKLRLAYKFDIYAEKPVSRQIVFVDAGNGNILGTREVIHTVNAPGTATTAYSGSQAITTDFTNNTYRLRETGRGNGIQTFNMKNGTNYAGAVDFTDTDNNWNNINAAKDQYATDAHWGTEKTYDYFKNKFNRNSINDAGLLLKSYVHTNLIAMGYPSNINAFWDGSRMSYGDGGSSNGKVYTPLTALDIAGHEIAHGLTQYTSELVYSYESGALNEGFSDIFGTAIEFYAKGGSANWLIGENIGSAFRSMSNPNLYGQPDTYKGTMWFAGPDDNGGVHYNSGVLNFWFYLLSQGGNGTNDIGTVYSVTGLGIDKAGAIAYRTNAFYLISTDKYADARTYSIKSAEDLYGVGSQEAIQTANAWTAVGVGGVVQPPACTDNYESNNTKNTSKTITTNSSLTAKISSSTDKDWYKFTTTANAPKIQVTVTNLPADYDVRLYNTNGSQIGISENEATSNETIKYNNSNAASTYYLQVYGYNGANSTNCYSFKVATSGVSFFGPQQTITGAPKKTGSFDVYPNPVTNGRVNVQFNNQTTAGSQQIIVTDLMGKIIFTKSVNVAESMNTLNVQLPKLAGGVYILKIGEMVKRITVQ